MMRTLGVLRRGCKKGEGAMIELMLDVRLSVMS